MEYDQTCLGNPLVGSFHQRKESSSFQRAISKASVASQLDQLGIAHFSRITDTSQLVADCVADNTTI